MAVQDAFDRFRQLGRHAGHTLFPNDFELYFVALELVDSEGEVIEYFAFPINPTSISVKQPQLTSVQQTAGGTTTISSDIFMPVRISLQGNFGRKMKFLIGRNLQLFQGLRSTEKGLFQKRSFSDTIKTGYGCIQVLRKIIHFSSQLDQYNKPHSLFLYNLSLGTNHLVRVMGDPSFTQQINKNMIWEYSIDLIGLLPYDELKKKSRRSNTGLFANYAVQNTVNNNINTVRDLL
jgi:hypothetical protein